MVGWYIYTIDYSQKCKEDREMGKIYGYCRVSTEHQSLARQERNILSEFPNATIVKEKFTGTTMERPVWTRLVKVDSNGKGLLSAGDTVVFDSVSRMARTAEDGFRAYMDLYKRGVNLVFIKERHIDTAVLDNASKKAIELTNDKKLNFIIDGVNKCLEAYSEELIEVAFRQSEKEVEDTRERIKEGILTRKLAGKQVGRKQGAGFTTKKEIRNLRNIKKYSKQFGGSLTDNELAKMLGIDRRTVAKYRNNILRDMANEVENLEDEEIIEYDDMT